MRVITYEDGASSRSAVVVGRLAVDGERAAERAGLTPPSAFATARGILAAGEQAWRELDAAAAEAAEGGEGRPVDDLVLRAPVEDPDKIICVGLNYRDHAEESGLEPPPAPMLFAKFRNSLVGPSASVVAHAASEAIDYEAELAVVIGRTARNVPRAEALSHVAGVMAFNDVTARDIQHATSQWMAGKAIDGFAPCGPALVFLDEIPDVHSLRIQARVNGECVQDGSTRNMIFDVSELVEFISGLMTLVPGDIIATGTPAGVGISRDPQVLLRPGDTMEVEIEGVGVLRNKMVRDPEPASSYAPT